MRIFGGIAIIFYSLVCLFFGFVLIVVAFNTFPVTQMEEVLEFIYVTPNIRLIMGITGLSIVFISLLIAQITSGKIQREKTIAFENPDGQVTVSLSAIEDLIKKVSRQIAEIKELRPDVIASKKGVSIINRVILFEGANIPDVTEKIQNIIKIKVQEMLGIEEPISVKVHVAKIASSEKPKEEKKEEASHVFKGIEYSSD